MLAAFEHDNNLVVPPLIKLTSVSVLVNIFYSCMVMSLENTLAIALIIPVNKGGCTAEHNTSFNHCVILLTTLCEKADHAYHTDSHNSCKINPKNRV